MLSLQSTTNCGCNSLILVHQTNEIHCSPLGPVHWHQSIHSKSSEITWHIGTHFVVVYIDSSNDSIGKH